MYKELSYNHFDSNIDFYGQEVCTQNFTFVGKNVREHYVLHFILKGTGKFTLPGRDAVTLTTGDMFLLPKGVPIFYQADWENPWQYIWIGFSGMRITEMFERSNLLETGYVKNATDSQFCQTFHELFQVLHNFTNVNADVWTESLVYKMFFHLLEEFPKAGFKQTPTSEIYFKQATSYIWDNYQNRINVTALCDYLALSRSYLHSLFQKYAKLSPQQYLLQVRMERAKQLLRESDTQLALISTAVGYKDYFTFSKAFKKYVGVSPKVYRQAQI